MTEGSSRHAPGGELAAGRGGRSAHALEVLELDRVLERVAARASSELGRARVRALAPSGDADAVRRELAAVGATLRFLDEKPAWGMPAVPDVTEALARLGVEGAVLEPVPLHRLGVLLASSRAVASELAAREGYDELRPVADLLVQHRDLEEDLERCVDADGQVLDKASPELARLRSRMRGAHARIVRALESFIGSLPERIVVPDASVTVRDGRYVVPIRREGKGEVGGIVHDESQTGATLFIEPPAAIELMNELRELEREEAREVHRVLRRLTGGLAPLRDALAGALEALVRLDSLVARARTAAAWRATPPEVVEVGGAELRVLEGRHPLLAEAEMPVIPFDLEMEPGERAVVVSGPNTGGKSVFLKAVGLISALAQSGVVPPVGAGTRLPVFGSFYADIGDEQSIAHSLSTFSAHLANLREVVEGARADSLVLIDEMGTGTDPAEGAALARAILETLVAAGALTLVSSHLGELKRLDAEGSGIVNASLQFDSERMEPTYRLLKGRPGRSYGLAIARRLGFPARVLDAADGYRDQGEAQVEDLLGRLERREREVEALLASLDRERAETTRLRRDVEEREASLRQAEQTAERRAREDARRVLLEARAEVEEAIREVREAGEREADLEEAATAARRRVEAAARRERRRAPGSPGRSGGAPDLAVGDPVRVVATGARGRVRELRAGRALVETGGLKLELPVEDLERASEPEEPRAPARSSGGWIASGGGRARVEVDLRGMRVDEMEHELARAMDQAVLDDLPELRIIHGKGTGALKQRVGELLSTDGRVREFRPGEPGEGGAGVTVATFR